MLAIMRGQRDRFRQRMLELEQEKEVVERKVQAAQASAQQLRRDNVKLYEKIKYLQSYRRDREVRIDIGKAAPSKRRDVDEKYKDLYEDEVNPFAVFNRNERSRRVDNLGAIDKATLFGGRMFVSNKHCRWFILVYSVGLHLIVFVTLHLWSLADHRCPTHSIVSRAAGKGRPALPH